MQLFWVYSLIFLSIIIITRGESTSIANETRILSRIKRVHLGILSPPQNNDDRKAIQSVINSWNYWGANDQKPNEIFNYTSGKARARLDLQGIENTNGI
jgi:hypothetical protein